MGCTEMHILEMSIKKLKDIRRIHNNYELATGNQKLKLRVGCNL